MSKKFPSLKPIAIIKKANYGIIFLSKGYLGIFSLFHNAYCNYDSVGLFSGGGMCPILYIPNNAHSPMHASKKTSSHNTL